MGICQRCSKETNNPSGVCASCASRPGLGGQGFSLSGLLGKQPSNGQQASATAAPQQPVPNATTPNQAPIQPPPTQPAPMQQAVTGIPTLNQANAQGAVASIPTLNQVAPQQPAARPLPVQPAQGSAPTYPVRPAQPTQAAQPVQPAQPQQPQPVQPVQPAHPAQPPQPAQTNMPAMPAIPQVEAKIKLETNKPIEGFGFDEEDQSASQGYKKAISQTSGTEQKDVEQRVYSSAVTGFGDTDLEISVLAGMMKDSYILDTLKGQGLMSGLFSTRFSRAIYQAILTLREENPELSSLDRIILRNKMRQMNLYDQTVQNLIDKIMDELPPAADQALHYLALMKEQALKRKLKEVSLDINNYIEKPEEHENHSIETFTNKVIHDVRNIQKARTTKRINLVKEEMQEIIEDMERREKEGEINVIGYSFEPMHYLCQAISGFRKGFMYAIAGAPRRGKTTFTLELATRVATLNKIPVLFFTYEQTKKNLTYRLLAKESRLNPDTLQRKRIYSDIISEAKFSGGWQKMQDYMDYFYIVEATKEDTVDRIRSYAYNAMQDFNTDDIMIFIDYLQKMPLSRNYNDEKFKVEEISTELKALSIELNNPIMTVSSLSKEGCLIDATESDERPTMYHCKGSGDLEYDLDCAMIQAKDWGDTKELYEQLQQRAEQLGKDSSRIPKVDVVNLFLDKNRDAPEGIFSVIQYLFFIEDNKFVELGPKFEDDRYRFGKIEELIDKLIADNFIVFFDKPKESLSNKNRVTIQLKNF